MRTQIIYDWCREGVRHPLGILWATLTGSTVWNRRRLRLDAAIRKRRPSATACRRFNEKKVEKGNSDVGFLIETERVGYLLFLLVECYGVLCNIQNGNSIPRMVTI